MKPINLFEYEDAAKQTLSPSAYAYYHGAAGDGITMGDDRRAYDNIKIMPHVLRDVTQRQLSTTVLGQQLDFPVVIAPMAMAAMAHPDKELAIARSAKRAGIPMCLSTFSTARLEDVGATDVNRWFQLYVHKDRGLTRELMQRAEDAGYTALVVTVDVPISGHREYLERYPLQLPQGSSLENLKQYWNPETYPSVSAYAADQIDSSLTWDDMETFIEQTSLPVLVKGILRADDAQEAVKRDVAGIIVSSHGGRQLDTVPATIDVLPEIAEMVDGQCEILIDGGIRRGTDIFKALALGANAVMLGRPVLWGLAVDGEAGVSDVLSIIRHEYDIALGLSGCISSESITRDMVHIPSVR